MKDPLRLLELRNQEMFLLNSTRPLPRITEEHKQRMIANLKEVDTWSPAEEERVSVILSILNELKTKEDDTNT